MNQSVPGVPVAGGHPRTGHGQNAFRGTPAQGSYAPDLTHFMSRATFAAGVAPNTREALRRWIDDPQLLKPGCLMPAFGLGDRDRELVVTYLLTLQ